MINPLKTTPNFVKKKLEKFFWLNFEKSHQVSSSYQFLFKSSEMSKLPGAVSPPPRVE